MLESFANIKEYINTYKHTHTFIHILVEISVCKSKQDNAYSTIQFPCNKVYVSKNDQRSFIKT